MKKFLLSLTLFTALLGVSLSAKADACTAQNLVFNIQEYITGANGKCSIRVNVGWNLANNNGFVLSTVHFWYSENYPNPAFNYGVGGNPVPNATFLANALGTIQVERPNNGALNSWVIRNTYKIGTGSPKMITSGNLTVTLANGGFNFSITDLIIELPSCSKNLGDISVRGDIWGSNNGQNQSCGMGNYNFLPPLADFNIIGNLTCGYKDGLPDNKINVQMTSNAAQANSYSVSYNVFVDKDGSGVYTPNDELLSKTINNISVFQAPTGTYNSGLISYEPYSNQYAYRTRAVHTVATVSYTQNGGGQFTRTITLSNTCQTQPVPAPAANSDYFDEGTHGIHTINANVYGGQTRWTSELAPASIYTTSSLDEPPAENAGLDVDPTDAPIGSMLFNLVPGSIVETEGCNGTGTVNVTLNSNGTFSIDRTNNICVYRVTFQYTITNTIINQVSNVATVTVDFTPQTITPVAYKSFTATRANNNQVVLEWETAMEENNKGFHVQRNVNGTWKNIGFVFSQANNGNSSEVLKYAFKDANNSKGISQYRILQVDIDGKGKYSQIRSVHGLETAARVVLFPNPSHTGSFNLLFEDATSLRDVVVSDVSGRVVKQFKAVSGSTLTVDGLMDGFYTVQVANRTSGTASVEKVIIKKR